MYKPKREWLENYAYSNPDNVVALANQLLETLKAAKCGAAEEMCVLELALFMRIGQEAADTLALGRGLGVVASHAVQFAVGAFERVPSV